MKQIILLSVLFLLAISMQAQTAKFGQIETNGKYQAYLTKNGDTVKIGDRLTIGKPTGTNEFNYISQGGVLVAARLAGDVVSVSEIKVYGSKKQGKTLFVGFKGYGMVTVFADYETAIDNGELINTNAGLTKQQALKQLKEAKELLDLEIIPQAKYDSIKHVLAPVIQNN